MNYRKRRLPSREDIRRTISGAGASAEPEAPELALAVMSAAGLVHEEILEPLEREEGLSEGKFILLMALRSRPDGLGVQALAEAVGVSVPTISVMLKRMQAAEKPLAAVERAPGNGRARVVKITEEGRALLKRVLPVHIEREEKLARRLDKKDLDQLVRLLMKLLESEPRA
jgi:DNA-binding MarR family transcriptional regulator